MADEKKDPFAVTEGEGHPASPADKEGPGVRGTEGDNANYNPNKADDAGRPARNHAFNPTGGEEEWDPHGGEEEQPEGTEASPRPE